MNDEHEMNEPEDDHHDDEETTPEGTEAIPDDDLDVEAALAAVASLGDLTAEAQEETETTLEVEPDDEEDEDEDEDEEETEPAPTYSPAEHDFPRPPLTTLRRGQMASIVPALLLIITGIWLTFTLTTAGAAPDGGLILAVIGGGIGITLLAQWLSSERWARGGFFGGALVLLIGATVFVLVRPQSTGLTEGWPLFIVAAAAAFVLTAVFTQPRSGRLALVGIITGVAGITAYAVTTGLLNSALVATLGRLWPLVLVAAAIILLAPFLTRRRG